jgi:alkaline phosphatase D
MASRFDPARRRLLRRSLAVGGLAAAAGLAGAARSSAQADRPLTRIAFGSCCNQDVPQPIWAAINAVEPEVFVFLGDNIYGDTREMDVLQRKYDQLAAQPGFRTLRERARLLAIWDDHDYGEDDAGADYPMKEESRRIFCDFWGEPADSPRRTRDGIYEAYLIGPPGRSVQFILPDLRFNRTPLIERDLAGADYEKWADSLAKAGKPVPGPYERNPARGPTMLGERQWVWLERQLAVPAELRILCSSLQVVADFPGWEAWVNYTLDQERLIDAIRRHDTRSLLCISGDTHYGELSMRDTNVPYPLWDLTSSGLTEVWPVIPPNGLRVGDVLQEANFGFIEIDWQDGEPQVDLQLLDVRGQPRLRHRLAVRSLVAGA